MAPKTKIDKHRQKIDLAILIEDELLLIDQLKCPPQQFNKLRANWYDNNLICAGLRREKQDQFARVRMGDEITATQVLQQVNEHWDNIKFNYPNVKYPYILFTPWIYALGLIMQYNQPKDNTNPDLEILARVSKNVVIINPTLMNLDGRNRTIYTGPHDLYPLFVFCHEMRHLEQAASGLTNLVMETNERGEERLVSYWHDRPEAPSYNYRLNGRTSQENYNTYITEPDEIDANNVANHIVSTIASNAKKERN